MRIINILNILEKYMTDYQKEYPFWAEHDVLGFNVDYTLISEEDMLKLVELGILLDYEYDSLIIFV